MPFGVGLIYLDNNLFDSFDSFERSIDRLCAAEARLSAERLCSRRFALFDFSNLESRRNNCSIRAQRASTPPVRSVLYLGVWARVIDPASGTVGGMTRGYRRSRKEGLRCQVTRAQTARGPCTTITPAIAHSCLGCMFTKHYSFHK